jgi:hypothetical protein
VAVSLAERSVQGITGRPGPGRAGPFHQLDPQAAGALQDHRADGGLGELESLYDLAEAERLPIPALRGVKVSHGQAHMVKPGGRRKARAGHESSFKVNVAYQVEGVFGPLPAAFPGTRARAAAAARTLAQHSSAAPGVDRPDLDPDRADGHHDA